MTLTPVERLRQMVGASPTEYTIGATAYWINDQLQDALDARVSARLLQAPVTMYPTIEAGTTVRRHGRVTVRGTLDPAAVQLVTINGQPIDPEDFELAGDGRIAFTDSQPIDPLASGVCYDLAAAAADVMTEWAAKVKLGYDVSTDGSSVRRSQRHAQLLAQAAVFRAQALPGAVSMRPAHNRRGGLVAAFDRIR